jgi:putative SOS response-associated peptidase YedK
MTKRSSPASRHILHGNNRAVTVILKPEAYADWIAPSTSAADAKALLKQHLGGDLQMYRVDRQINSSRWPGDETAIEPI